MKEPVISLSPREQRLVAVIKEQAARWCGVSIDDIDRPSKLQSHVGARHLAMNVMRRRGFSHRHIALAFHRDRAAVRAALAKADRPCTWRRLYGDAIDEVEAAVDRALSPYEAAEKEYDHAE